MQPADGVAFGSALVTGAGRGYGLELSRRLASQGAQVFGVLRDPDTAAAFAVATRGRGTLVVADVAEDAAVGAIGSALAAHGRPLDLLVNNAGLTASGSRVEDVRLADLDRLLQVHLHGALRCTQAALPWLRRSPHGTVVNVTSRLGSIARVAAGAYDHLGISYAMRISKAAQNMLTACLHRELRAEGIAVYAVHPGRLRTRMGSADADVEAGEAAARLLDWLARVRGTALVAYAEPDRDELPW
jgi:NAD(P)-dependent dehydrogenase (short-subunit alcohol dehydrogenase family)